MVGTSAKPYISGTAGAAAPTFTVAAPNYSIKVEHPISAYSLISRAVVTVVGTVARTCIIS